MKLIALTLAAIAVFISSAFSAEIPMNATATTTPASTERLTFGGGCFWCLEAVFQRLAGVKSVASGYAGGERANPTYDQVSSGASGHAEVVQIAFDPAQLPLEKLLEIFWAAHDPTTLNRQGADSGTQYRSIILYENEEQKAAAEKSKAAAQSEFKNPIVTQIVPLKAFYKAEGYHQNYYNQNSGRNPYCSVVITPKLQKLIHKGMITQEPLLK